MGQNKYNFRQFFQYTFLSVLGTLGVSCYILADTFFISKGLGNDGLTALNLAIPAYSFVHGTALMLGVGGATGFSVSKSRSDSQRANMIFTVTVIAGAVLGVLFALCGAFLSRPLSRMLGANDEVLDMTDTYLRWLLIFSPAFMLNEIMLCFMRNDNAPQLSMAAMLIGSLANTVLDYVFVFPLKMGILGAVLATVFSPVISLAIMCVNILRKKNTFRAVKVKNAAKLLLHDFRLGFPSLLAQFSSGITIIVFNYIILRLKGNVGVAAYGIIANISVVIVAIYTGMAQGIQPLISNAHGSGNTASARSTVRLALIATTISSLAIYFAMFLLDSQIVSIFNNSGNQELRLIAEPGIKLYFTSTVFVGINLTIATYFTSIENALPAHILTILRGFAIIIPLAYLMSAIWGMTGVWLAYPITELVVAVAGAIIYLVKIKKGVRQWNH